VPFARKSRVATLLIFPSEIFETCCTYLNLTNSYAELTQLRVHGEVKHIVHFVATNLCLDRSTDSKTVSSDLLISTVHYLLVPDNYTLVSNIRLLSPRHVALEIYQVYKKDSIAMFLS
jgi:hypothetical protein